MTQQCQWVTFTPQWLFGRILLMNCTELKRNLSKCWECINEFSILTVGLLNEQEWHNNALFMKPPPLHWREWHRKVFIENFNLDHKAALLWFPCYRWAFHRRHSHVQDWWDITNQSVNYWLIIMFSGPHLSHWALQLLSFIHPFNSLTTWGVFTFNIWLTIANMI